MSHPNPERRPVPPVDAASVVIVRGQGDKAEVLMGRRRPRASFMPDVYVFPGGRVDPEDVLAPPGVAPRPEVAAGLTRRCRSAAATTLAITIARETFEETGLLLCGRADKFAPGSVPDTPLWRAYREAGALPGLDALDYIARAITPSSSPKRFNTRFFMADAGHFRGELQGDAELLDLHWVLLAEAGQRLKIPNITQYILDEAAFHVSAAPEARAQRPVPLRYHIGKSRRVVHE